MAPRPQWKGYLKLSLVSCAVALYPATSSSQRTSFNTLNRETGHRVRRQYIDAETGEPVPPEAQARGYEIAKDTYVLIEDDELDEVALESTHTIDIERFVDRASVDERYLDKPHYLAPNDAVAQQAFAVIRDAMRGRGMVGLARVVLSRREHLAMIEPFEAGMLVTTLHYAYEVREAQPYFEDIAAVETPREMLDLAGHIIETKTGTFDPSTFEDRYEKALVELIRSKQAGEPIKARAPSRPGNVVDLMEALRKSLAASRPAAAQAAPAGPQRRSAEPTKQSAARRPKQKSGGRPSRLRKAS
jgi:DNA end-binding protein Ku